MNSLRSRVVVDQMVSDLAERRRTAVEQRRAYATLVEAILAPEARDPRGVARMHRRPTTLRRSARAA